MSFPVAYLARRPRRALRRGSLVAASMALAGCASVLVTPDPHLNHVAVPATWSNGTAAPAPASLAGWWQRFNDPQLTALVTQALERNSDVRTAQAALLQARAQRDVVAAGLLPTVNAAASAQRSKTGDKRRQFLSGRIRRELGAGHLRRRRERCCRCRCRCASRGVVAREHPGLDRRRSGCHLHRSVRLESRLAIARDNLASQEETLQIAQWRAQAGLTTSLDVEQARTSTELTRAQIPALGASIAQSRSSLAVLTGVDARGAAMLVARSDRGADRR